MRSFLNPGECIRWWKSFPTESVFVQGELRTDSTPPELFRAVVADCRKSPFLFAKGDSRVLLGFLSGSNVDKLGSPSVPVLPTLQEYLREIVVAREPVDSLHLLVAHRYGLPFSRTPGSTE